MRNLNIHISYQWGLAIVSLIVISSQWFLIIWFLPFYRWNYNLLRAGVLSISMWASWCLVFVMAIADINNSITIMFFVTTPAMLLLSYFAAKTRRDFIMKGPITAFTHPFVVELKV